MSLGETIYRLRTKKNLSQGDLAELLEVSRQSVSKWENDSAMPDLTKIVKLSEVFEVSLDELVKGESKMESRESAVLQGENDLSKTEIKSGYNDIQTKVPVGFPGRKIAGIILFCMAFLVMLFLTVVSRAVAAGIVYASPFWLCGILCFALKRNVGLWCAWAVYGMFDTCLAYMLGFSRVVALTALRSGGWTVGSVFAWAMIVALIVLIAVTALCFGKKPLPAGQRGKLCLFVPWIAWLVLHGFSFLLGSTLTRWFNAESFGVVNLYRFTSILLSWGRIVSLTVGLVMLLRYIKSKKTAEGESFQ